MLTAQQIAVFEQISEMMEQAWDDVEIVHDIEYEDYLPQIFSLKENKASVEAIAQKIFQIQNQRCKYEVSLAQCRHVAEKINAL